MARKSVPPRRRPVRRKARKPSRRNPAAAAPAIEELLVDVKLAPDNIAAVLALGSHYHAREEDRRTLEAIEHLEKLYPFLDDEANRSYDRLLAYGYADCSRWSDAERIVERGISRHPDEIDYYYVGAFVHMSLSEFEATVAVTDRYAELLDNASATSSAITARHHAQLLNIRAGALKEMGRIDDAIACYFAAIDADLGNHLPYLNLYHLLMSQRRRDEALTVLKRGLNACRQVHELRMLLEGDSARSSVSVCMIVKDEEELLPACLDSVRDWVDEIIIVDTGSTDRTVEIAESYGARVYHQHWEGNFSKHRNYSIEQASGDWILILDADERVEPKDIPTIRRLLNSNDYDYIGVDVNNVYRGEVERVTFLPSVRFFRRGCNLRYEGIVHNVLKIPAGLRSARVGARIWHYGYDLSEEKMRKKKKRTRDLLEKQLADNPDNAFAHFNYAQLLLGDRYDDPSSHADTIIRSATRGIELTDPNKSSERHIHLMCLNQLAWIHFYEKEFEKSHDFAGQALALKENYLDPLLLLGHLHANFNEMEASKQAYEQYLSYQAAYDAARETDNIILSHLDSRVTALYNLGLIAESQNDARTARRRFEQVVELSPDHADVNLHLGRLLLDGGDLAGAETCFRRQLDRTDNSVGAHVGLARVRMQRGAYSDAETHFRVALDLDPESPSAQLYLGRLYLETGRATEAAGCFARLEETGRGDSRIRRELAEVYYQAGRFAEAAPVYERLAEDSPDGEILNDLANCYVKLERLADAEPAYRRALNSSRPLPATFRNLGLVLARQNRLEEAADMLGRYLELEPDETDCLLILGDLLVRTGRHSEAIPLFEKYLRMAPDHQGALLALSDCYLNLGHRESAELGYKRLLQLDPASETARRRLELLKQPAARA